MVDRDSESFVLGIDVGTTSIKVSLLRNNTRDAVESFSCETGANICAEALDFAEQDVAKILASLHYALGQLSTHFLVKVSSIGICGQMHGCVMWRGHSCVTWDTSEFRDYVTSSDNVSHLITWEDRRCTSEFLATLPATRTNVAISTGFGCASLFWLQGNRPNLLERFDCAGTIMDFIVCVLCQMDKPCMSSHNAVSWGYFHFNNMKWELDILKQAKFPTHLLPVVVKPDAVAGKLQRPFYNIPVGTPVGVGLGDFQCSVLATMSQQSDAVLNIGTSCQLAVVVPDSVCDIDYRESPNLAKHISREALQLLPFFEGRKVITAASLSGT